MTSVVGSEQQVTATRHSQKEKERNSIVRDQQDDSSTKTSRREKVVSTRRDSTLRNPYKKRKPQCGNESAANISETMRRTSTTTTSKATVTPHCPQKKRRSTKPKHINRLEKNPSSQADEQDHMGCVVSTRQYPHRVGRVRASKDFGVSLALNSTMGASSSRNEPFSVTPNRTPSISKKTHRSIVEQI